MILLCDNETKVFGTLWHIGSDSTLSIIKYGPGQLSLAKEYIPNNEPYFVHANMSNIWRKVLEPGVVKVIDHDDVPKEIKLYLFLLGD